MIPNPLRQLPAKNLIIPEALESDLFRKTQLLQLSLTENE